MAFFDDGADGDGELEVLGFWFDVADDAGVNAAGVGFELVDDLAGAFFGAAGDGAAGEHGDKRFDWRCGEVAVDFGVGVPDVGGFEELAVGFELDAAGFGYFADVVAEEVGDHVEFGGFFGGFHQGFGVEVGAFDGFCYYCAVFDRDEGFGRGGDEGEFGGFDEGGVGGGVDLVEAVENFFGSEVGSGVEAMSEIDLVDVAFFDVGLDFLVGGVVFLASLFGGEFGEVVFWFWVWFWWFVFFEVFGVEGLEVDFWQFEVVGGGLGNFEEIVSEVVAEIADEEVVFVLFGELAEFGEGIGLEGGERV